MTIINKLSLHVFNTKLPSKISGDTVVLNIEEFFEGGMVYAWSMLSARQGNVVGIYF